MVDHLEVAPEAGYSFESELKQCGHEAMTFFTPAPCRVSMFCWACIWNRYSLPSRRTGSPVHDSAGPKTAKLTPAWCNRRAID